MNMASIKAVWFATMTEGFAQQELVDPGFLMMDIHIKPKHHNNNLLRHRNGYTQHERQTPRGFSSSSVMGFLLPQQRLKQAEYGIKQINVNGNATKSKTAILIGNKVKPMMTCTPYFQKHGMLVMEWLTKGSATTSTVLTRSLLEDNDILCNLLSLHLTIMCALDYNTLCLKIERKKSDTDKTLTHFLL